MVDISEILLFVELCAPDNKSPLYGMATERMPLGKRRRLHYFAPDEFQIGNWTPIMENPMELFGLFLETPLPTSVFSEIIMKDYLDLKFTNPKNEYDF